jgi:hypothetical protein
MNQKKKTEKESAPQSKKKPDGKESTVHIELPVKYSDLEIADLARAFGKLKNEHSLSEVKFDSIKEQFKGEMAKTQLAMDKILNEIMKGTRIESVKCHAYSDAKGKLIKIIRADTGEEVKDGGQFKLPLNMTQDAAAKKGAHEVKHETKGDGPSGATQPIKTAAVKIVNDRPGLKYKKFIKDDAQGVPVWESVELKAIVRGDGFRVVNMDGTEFKDAVGNNFFRARDQAKKVDKFWAVDITALKIELTGDKKQSPAKADATQAQEPTKPEPKTEPAKPAAPGA